MPWLRHYEGENLEAQSIAEAMRLWPLPVLLMMGQSDLRPPIPEDLLARAKQLTDEGHAELFLFHDNWLLRGR